MSAKVLIVEDEAPVRELLGTWLEQEGYEICAASDGEEALRAVKESPPDLIVLDMVMPQFDGFEFCRSVREQSSAPIVVLTGLGDESQRVEAFRLGAADYLVKPIGMQDFLARIETVLGG